MIVIHPDMTVTQLVAILDQNCGRDVEAYIRIESIRGRPVGYLVREPRIPLATASLLRRQAE